ncbi:MAG: nuclear transport factor 2 family protein [Reyranellaceae bacterium]
MSQDERQPVAAANRAFYKAFSERDYAGMDQVWARNSPVACIHPGWPPIFRREQVMASWRGILGNPQQSVVTCSDERILVNGDTAIVICTEKVAGNALVATNVFVREDGAWRMIHHQAGPRPAEEPPKQADEPKGKRILH